VNLAIGDIMYATFIAPEVIMTTLDNHPGSVGGTVLCKMLTGGILAWVGGLSAMVTLVVIAFERYYAVIYPYSNRKLTTKKLKVSQCLMGWARLKLVNFKNIGPIFNNACITDCKNTIILLKSYKQFLCRLDELCNHIIAHPDLFINLFVHESRA